MGCRISMFQYTRSKYHKSGIAQSVYVTQGFSPVTFATGTDGTMGTVEKKRIDSLHGNLGHMTTSLQTNTDLWNSHSLTFQVGLLPAHNDQQLHFAFSVYQTTGPHINVQFSKDSRKPLRELYSSFIFPLYLPQLYYSLS